MPTPHLNENDMIDGTLVLRRTSTRQRPTVVRVQYTDNTAIPWRQQEVQAVDGAAAEAWRESSVSLPGITSRQQAYREAVERLNAAKFTDLSVEWQAFDEAIKYLPGDVVQLTHPVGLAAVALRIMAVDVVGPGRWRITAASYNAAIYSDGITAPWSGDYTDLPSPDDIPLVAGIVCESGSSHLLLASDGTIISRLYVSWDTPTYPYSDAIEVQFKRLTDTVWQSVTGIDGVYCAPVQDGATYNVRCRIRNVFGTTGSWASTTHLVVGKTEPPPAPRNFLVGAYADGTRVFTWQPPLHVPLDLAGYRLRYKTGTVASWAEMTALHQGTLSSSPYETNALSAGTYVFAVATVDTSGNVSDAVYLSTTIPDPRLSGALDVFDVHVLGWPGTKTNCWVDPWNGWLLATDTKTWDDLGNEGISWQEWTTWVRDPADMTYEHSVIDVGVVTRFTPLVSVICPDGSPTITVSTSSNGTDWSAWSAANVPVEARYLKVKAEVTGGPGDVLRLEQMVILLDADPVEETIEDLDTSTLTGDYDLGVGDIRLPITEAFAVIRSVSVTLQNTGAGWTWELIDKNTTTGPRIKIYNSSNAAADATIDAVIRGL